MDGLRNKDKPITYEWVVISEAARRMGKSRVQMHMMASEGKIDLWVRPEPSINCLGEEYPFVVHIGRLLPKDTADEGYKVAMPDQQVLMFERDYAVLKGDSWLKIAPLIRLNHRFINLSRDATPDLPVELFPGVILHDGENGWYGVSERTPRDLEGKRIRAMVGVRLMVKNESVSGMDWNFVEKRGQGYGPVLERFLKHQLETNAPIPTAQAFVDWVRKMAEEEPYILDSVKPDTKGIKFEASGKIKSVDMDSLSRAIKGRVKNGSAN